MDVLSKELDRSALLREFNPHPKCFDPFITHLSFADDMLIFFDGAKSSQAAILNLLNRFYTASGLYLNLSKSKLFLDGSNPDLNRILANRFNLSPGKLPVKYLGLPLLPEKLKTNDYQPLIDKINSKILSWLATKLSFAGRLQLINSVLFSIVNFWSFVFPLPKSCFKVINMMCASFLWRGVLNSTTSAKVAWLAMCQPKCEGGLRLVNLDLTSKVFGLKLIWLLFSQSGSLWVAWIKAHLIKRRLFWTGNISTDGSWIWKKLAKLRPLARPFLFCRIESGDTAMFWHDNWTGLGSLLHITGDLGPVVAGIPFMANVSQALASRNWSQQRRRHPILHLLRDCIQTNLPSSLSAGPNLYLWKSSHTDVPCHFSTFRTRETIRKPKPSVPWCKVVWFKHHVPKHAFFLWILMKGRLSSRDKLRSWGLNVPPSCLLCNSGIENQDHLFFQCPFSYSLWISIFHSNWIGPAPTMQHALTWIQLHTNNKRLSTINYVAFQAIAYYLWKERNSRLHSSAFSTIPTLTKQIQIMLRAKLASLDRPPEVTHANPPFNSRRQETTYLSTWFHLFQP